MKHCKLPKVRARLRLPGPQGGAELIRGAERAAGEWLLFLHADTFLNEGWALSVLDHLKKHPDKAGFFKLRFRATGVWARLVAGWANVRSRLFGLPYGDQGLLISRELYAQVGGYQNIPLMEDVAMAKSLRGKLRALGCIAWTSADRYEQQGWFKRGARNLSLLLRYKFGASPEKLADLYTRKPSDEARSQP